MQMIQAECIQDGFDVSDFSGYVHRWGKKDSALGCAGRAVLSLGGECQPAAIRDCPSQRCVGSSPTISLSQCHSVFLYSSSCLIPLHLCFQCHSSFHFFYHWAWIFHSIYPLPTNMYYWHICFKPFHLDHQLYPMNVLNCKKPIYSSFRLKKFGLNSC